MASIIVSFGFVYVSAQSRYRIAKPIVIDLEPAPPSMKLFSFSLVYESQTNRYTTVVLKVSNVGDKPMYAKGTVFLYDEVYNQVAWGEKQSLVVEPGADASIDIKLKWMDTMTVRDFTAATLTLQEIMPEEPEEVVGGG